MKTDGTCNFCRKKDRHFEDKYCSIECADFREDPFFYIPKFIHVHGEESLTYEQRSTIDKWIKRNRAEFDKLMANEVKIQYNPMA